MPHAEAAANAKSIADAVEPNVANARRAFGRKPDEQAQERRCHSDANRAARQRHNRAFDEQLRRQPSARAAERRAHGQLVLPRSPARDEQIRDVGACDEQQESDGSEQHVQRQTDLRNGPGQQELRFHADAAVRVRVLALQAGRNRAKILFGRLPA